LCVRVVWHQLEGLPERLEDEFGITHIADVGRMQAHLGDSITYMTLQQP
jgi:hypothetical protein